MSGTRLVAVRALVLMTCLAVCRSGLTVIPESRKKHQQFGSLSQHQKLDHETQHQKLDHETQHQKWDYETSHPNTWPPNSAVRLPASGTQAETLTSSPTFDSKARKETSHRALRYSHPLDHYRCADCECHHTKLTHRVYATCTGTYTACRSRIPQDLPVDTSQLDLSRNLIQRLDTAQLVLYRSLAVLLLTRNHLKHVRNSDCSLPVNIRYLDLSQNKIEFIGDEAFSCMRGLKKLVLRVNSIRNITDRTFYNLRSLKVLDLSYNKLLEIQPGAFSHFPALQLLDLSRNKDMVIASHHAETFQSLKSLHHLHIEGCAATGVYPTDVLLRLDALRELYVNGESTPFDPRLASLRNLTKLVLGGNGYCWTKNFSSSYFSGLPFLESLSIDKCRPDTISAHLFQNSTRLVNVSLSSVGSNIVTLGQVFESICSIPYPENVKSLTVADNAERAFFRPLVILQKSNVTCISRMSRLENFNLDRNSISQVTTGFSIGLPKSLISLSFKGNFLIPYHSLLNQIYYLPKVLPNLKILHEDDQGFVDITEELNSARHNRLGNVEPLNLKDHLRGALGRGNMPRIASAHDAFLTDYIHLAWLEPKEDPQSHAAAGVYRPATGTQGLEMYTASRSFDFGKSVFRWGDVGIRYLNLSSTLIADWGKGPVNSVPQSTQVLDLSNNKCVNISANFFPPNNSLLELHASGNFLGPQLHGDYSGSWFAPLSKLQFLDLSNNHIFSLPRASLQGMSKLQVLHLASNNIDFLDLQVANLSSLSYVNVAKNAITGICKTTRNELDILAKNKLVILDLTNNPLPCNCDGLELLHWLRDTPVHILDRDFLLCRDSSHTWRYIGQLESRLLQLRAECMTQKLLVMSCSFGSALLLAIGLAAWVFHRRWWILYMRNLVVSRFFGFKSSKAARKTDSPAFTFDSYFVSSPSSLDFILDQCLEELEVKRGHNLCVEERDFLAGSFIPCNITSAVRSSRKTVVVLDAAFRYEGWGRYSLEMAQVEAVRAQRDVLHLVVLGSLPEGRLPDVIFKVAKEGHVSEVPPAGNSPEVIEEFWDSLSKTIGHSRRGRRNVRPRLEIVD